MRNFYEELSCSVQLRTGASDRLVGMAMLPWLHSHSKAMIPSGWGVPSVVGRERPDRAVAEPVAGAST